MRRSRWMMMRPHWKTPLLKRMRQQMRTRLPRTRRLMRKPLLKKPSVVIMQDCGHAPMIERPEETARHYQAFLDASRG